MYEDLVENYQKELDLLAEGRHGARQYLEIHGEIARRTAPTVLELGVDAGRGTKIFLNALYKAGGGLLISVDIVDLAHVAQSPQWQFVQSDSADIDHIVDMAPILKQGIDVLYVDSLHTEDHVRKEVYGFYPYVKKGGAIFFDDIESFPYMENQRKDNIHTEIGNRQILGLINSIFESNMDQLDMTVLRGSTGLARFDKRSEMGTELAPATKVAERRNKRHWKWKRSLQKRTRLFSSE